MKILRLLLFLEIGFLSSCSNSNNTANEGQTNDTKVKNESCFLSNEEVKNLIKTNNSFFMSFWPGMTKNEVVEVTRYLLAKEEINGIVFDPDDDSSSYLNRCSNFSLDFDNKCGYRELNKNNYYLLLEENAKKYSVLIGGTIFEIEFNYTYLNNENLLKGIQLTAVSELTTSTPIDFDNYLNVAKLYEEKYGMPSKKYSKPPLSGGMVYNLGSTEINLYYNAEGSLPQFGPGRAPNQIHIEYKDNELINRSRSSYELKRSFDRTRNQNIRDSLEKANKINSLKRI
jgi:hypothetical protein